MKNEITAKRLALALENAGITAAELSKSAKVSEASISQYINGTHKPSNLSSGKMAKILNVDPLWLMGFDTPTPQPKDEPEFPSFSPNHLKWIKLSSKLDDEQNKELYAIAKTLVEKLWDIK